MAIQPLDLQTLFTQLDKIGKLQSAERDGLAIQQSLQSGHLQKKNEEQVHSVEQTKETDQGAEAVNDKNARKKNSGSGGEKNQEKEKKDDPEEKNIGVFQDPSLGKNIDLSF
jgi:hypothetical protein